MVFLLNGCHVPNDSHLATWGLDTAPMDDLHCDAVERWSLCKDVGLPAAPTILVEDIFGTYVQGGLDQTRLGCPVREVFPKWYLVL